MDNYIFILQRFCFISSHIFYRLCWSQHFCFLRLWPIWGIRHSLGSKSPIVLVLKLHLSLDDVLILLRLMALMLTSHVWVPLCICSRLWLSNYTPSFAYWNNTIKVIWRVQWARSLTWSSLCWYAKTRSWTQCLCHLNHQNFCLSHLSLGYQHLPMCASRILDH